MENLLEKAYLNEKKVENYQLKKLQKKLSQLDQSVRSKFLFISFFRL